MSPMAHSFHYTACFALSLTLSRCHCAGLLLRNDRHNFKDIMAIPENLQRDSGNIYVGDFVAIYTGSRILYGRVRNICPNSEDESWDGNMYDIKVSEHPASQSSNGDDLQYNYSNKSLYPRDVLWKTASTERAWVYDPCEK
ncbi:hypothetical protein ABKN59_009576 [Abortiporus biennis]